MPRALLAVLLGLLLLGCGSEVVPGTATLIVPTATALPASPPTADLLPTSAPVTVTRVPSDTLALPAMSANQQIFATGTAERAVRLTARAAQPTATPVPPPVATAPPPTQVPTRAPTKAPTKAPTAVAAQRPPTVRPTAPLPPTPASCLTAAQTTYINQAEAIIDALHDAEAIIIASDQSQVPYGRDPTKTARSVNAISNIWALQKRGQALHAPPGWDAAQVHWDAAMIAFNRLYFAYASPVLAFNEAEDNFIQFQLDLRDLIAMQCS